MVYVEDSNGRTWNVHVDHGTTKREIAKRAIHIVMDNVRSNVTQDEPPAWPRSYTAIVDMKRFVFRTARIV